MPQPDWQARLVRATAGEIRRWRENRRMSAQQLATACTKLGLSISRSTLADLENGRRTTLTVAELLVIAAALEVEPLRLLVPLDGGNVEILPGVEVDPWKATRDFAGLDSEELALLAEYNAEERNLRSLLRASIRGGTALEVPERRMIPRAIGALAQARQKFASRGLAEPELAPDVQKMLTTPYILNGEPVVAAVPAEREQRQPTAQPVVAAIVTSDLGVLVGQRRDGNPPWTFIAGEQRLDERPEQTAEREVKEEAGGLKVHVGERIGERVHPKTGRLIIYMAARPTHGTEIVVGDPEELTAVDWVSLAKADELMADMFGPVREHLARELGEALDGTEGE